jgi:hypothetical protein
MRLEKDILFVVVVGLFLGGRSSAEELAVGGLNSGPQYTIAPYTSPLGPSVRYPLNNSDATLQLPQQSVLMRYPMNYSDEAAQSLGVRNGHIQLFSVRPAGGDTLTPAISGAIDHGGAAIKLQWHLGQ